LPSADARGGAIFNNKIGYNLNVYNNLIYVSIQSSEIATLD
jgi:hypothetical protein